VTEQSAAARSSPDPLWATQSGSTRPSVPLIPDVRVLPELLTVAETATVLRVGRSWVYQHAAELGAVKLGSGRTAPLRIPRDEVRRLLELPRDRRERRRRMATTRGTERAMRDTELRLRPRL
jgi:excisionase family DNA binding protein